MTNADSMYRWRMWNADERRVILQERRSRNQSPHSLPHIESEETTIYLITAACFEHKPHIGQSEARMQEFSIRLIDLLDTECESVIAWVVLPNHYHVLVDTKSITPVLKELGLNHGRTSFEWNGDEDERGRKVWFNAAETAMKSERHYYATINYVLHNPVHHRYCAKWTDWPFSSASEYLESIGREKAIQRWQEYPLFDYGKSWDPADL